MTQSVRGGALRSRACRFIQTDKGHHCPGIATGNRSFGAFLLTLPLALMTSSERFCAFWALPLAPTLALMASSERFCAFWALPLAPTLALRGLLSVFDRVPTRFGRFFDFGVKDRLYPGPSFD